MSIDLNLLVLNQLKPSAIGFDSSIIILNEIDDSEEFARYHSIFPFTVGNKGIWYSLVTPDPEFDGFYLGHEICRSEYDKIDEALIPFWVKSSNVIECLTPVIVNDKFKMDFKRIITFMITQSPTKTMMFLPRYQCADYEIVYGLISISDFFELLDDKKILFNICYILKQ